MNKRTQYTREFKLEAVKLLNSGQKPTTELPQELGIQRSVLYRWRDEYAEQGRAGNPYPAPSWQSLPIGGAGKRDKLTNCLPTGSFSRIITHLSRFTKMV